MSFRHSTRFDHNLDLRSTRLMRRLAGAAALAAFAVPAASLIAPASASASPIDPGDLTLPEPADECVYEYSGDHFGVVVGRYVDDPSYIEVQLTYTSSEVCDWTVWTSLSDGDDNPLGDTTDTMTTVEAATDPGYYQRTFPAGDLCDFVVEVAVEESLPVSYPYSDEECPPADEAPVEEVPVDEAPVEEVPVDEVPVDEVPVDGEESLVAGGTESSDTPGTPSGSLPTTGTDTTALMLGLGFLTLGAGSIVALATRRRDELSVA